MNILSQLQAIYDLGGPVIAIMIGLSVVALAVILWKAWQFAALGVGRHDKINRAIEAWDHGKESEAKTLMNASRNSMAQVLTMPGGQAAQKSRVEAATSAHLAQLEKGFRILDSIAQIAPLLGLFGTVLGMIGAFQALQEAGNSVDPSLLAGGIWVALLTTAAGLAVAMPTSLVLTFFDGRVAAERTLAETAIEARFSAPAAATTSAAAYEQPLRHAG